MTTAIATPLEIRIGGKTYGMEILDGQEHKTIRLTSESGTVYDVVQGDTRTTCDCGDFTHRHADLDFSDGCKHIQTLVKSGHIFNVAPWSNPAPMQHASAPTMFGDDIQEAKPIVQEAKPVVQEAKPDAKPAPLNLPEKYRPRHLRDLVGQGDIVFDLQELIGAPASVALLFSGDTGVGKTSAALAFARDLGCSVDDGKLGGVHQIESGNQTADNVRDALEDLYFTPMFGEIHTGGRWKVLIVNECDKMSETVANIWLDALEDLPPRTVVIFSTNNHRKLARRFRDRCEVYEFRSDADTLMLDAQARVNDIWFAETGRTDAPRVDDLPGAIEDGQLSFRACVQALVPLVRRASRGKGPDRPVVASAKKDVQEAVPAPTAAQEVTTAPKEDVPGDTPKRKTEAIDWHAIARRKAAGAKDADLAMELGIPRQTIYRQLKRIGK